MKYILPIIFFLLGCHVAFGEEIKVGRLHTVELCPVEDQVVVHQIGVEADTMHFEKDGKRCLVIVPQREGKITLMLTIVNFEDRKLESKDMVLECVGEKPATKPAPDSNLRPLSRLLTLLDSRYHSFIVHTIMTLSEGVEGHESLVVARVEFNDLLRRAIEGKKATDKVADEVDFAVFLDAVHEEFNTQVTAGVISNAAEYRNHLRTIGE